MKKEKEKEIILISIPKKRKRRFIWNWYSTFGALKNDKPTNKKKIYV